MLSLAQDLMLCPPPPCTTKHNIAQGKDSIKSCAKDSIYKMYDSPFVTFVYCCVALNQGCTQELKKGGAAR